MAKLLARNVGQDGKWQAVTMSGRVSEVRFWDAQWSGGENIPWIVAWLHCCNNHGNNSLYVQSHILIIAIAPASHNLHNFGDQWTTILVFGKKNPWMTQNGMCAWSIAFMHIMALRLLTSSGSKSDKIVWLSNPIKASKSLCFPSSGRWRRGSLTSFELQKPGKLKKKCSSSWSLSKQPNVHRNVQVLQSDGESKADSSMVFCMLCLSHLK